MHLLINLFFQLFRAFVSHSAMLLLIYLKVKFYSNIPEGIYKDITNGLYFIIFWVCVFSRRLFLINYHQIFGVHSRFSFYLGCILYYYFIYYILGRISYFYQFDTDNPLRSYFVFLLFLIFFNMIDYIAPSYKRYLKLSRQHKWNVSA